MNTPNNYLSEKQYVAWQASAGHGRHPRARVPSSRVATHATSTCSDERAAPGCIPCAGLARGCWASTDGPYQRSSLLALLGSCQMILHDPVIQCSFEGNFFGTKHCSFQFVMKSMPLIWCLLARFCIIFFKEFWCGPL